MPRRRRLLLATAAPDAGIDGITPRPHLGSLALIEDHPRFRDAKIGIIVSSVRALQLFLKKNAASTAIPDYIVVEGPLAGGHLGFGMDWAEYDLATITAEVIHYLREENSISRSFPRRHLHWQRRCRFPGAGALPCRWQRAYGGEGMRPA